MTREEEIKMQAEKKALEPSCLMHPYAKQYKVMSAYEIGYIEGAVWADEHPHWISIDDELPPCNVFVLTCDKQENTNLLMLAGDGRWYDKAVGLHRNITHWMPLPQAPKKGGEQ